jgi:hypothetical protein
MITVGVEQLLAHVIGDFLLQSYTMAVRKCQSFPWALLHATVYMVPFAIWLRPSGKAMLVMWLSHALIDHYRLARYVTFAKNQIFSPWWKDGFDTWARCSDTGFPPEAPKELTTWLNIISDNILHVMINALALAFL